jgi:hypothetical protein
MKYHRICANKKCKKSPDGGRAEFETNRSDAMACCNGCAQTLHFEKRVRNEVRNVIANLAKSKMTLQDYLKEGSLEQQLMANG